MFTQRRVWQVPVIVALILLLAQPVFSKGGIVDLGSLGGGDSGAFGVNNRGQVVGYSSTVHGIQL